MIFRSRSRASRRLLLAGILAAALTTGLAAAAAPAAQAAANASVQPPPPPRPQPLSEAQAAARARATGNTVIAAALTSPTSLTRVSPDGTATATETMLPTRAWHDGAWHTLDPDLSTGPRSTVVPAVTASGVVLSGGGSGPLAVLDNHGRTLSLSWPAPLPAPQLSGATATYPGVLPGVNLAVTVSAQGGLSEVLIVTSAAAAADPGLARLAFGTSAPGLHVLAENSTLRVAASTTGQPVFTAPAPQMWDAGRLPARARTVTAPGGTVLAVPSGLPAYASAAGPGAGSKVTQVPATVSGGQIVLAPPAGALAGPGITYPVYIDPSFEPDPVNAGASNWTQVDSGFPATSYWDESSQLQAGYCDFSGCNGLGVARAMFTMPVPSQITSTTVVNAADLYMTDTWSATCTAETIQLWRTSAISSSVTWDHQPSWNTNQAQTISDGCNGTYTDNNVGWNVIGGVTGAVAAGDTTMTFGLRAGSETSDLDWKQFLSGSANLTLSVSYHNTPSTPVSLQTAPAGGCGTSASPTVIGNDDVTLSAVVGDVDNANGDGTLNTAFTVYSAASGGVVDTIPPVTSVNQPGGVAVSTPIPRTTIQGWAPNDSGSISPYTYYWTAATSDTASPVLTSPTAGPCYFEYEPAAPGQPTVTFPGNNTSAAIGSSIQVTFNPPAGCTAEGTNPCPASYTYQTGVNAPVTETVTAADNYTYTGTITVTQYGPIELSVYGTDSAGNQGPSQGYLLSGLKPAKPYPAGYFTGSSYPSVLTLGAGNNLLLSAGTGNGTLSPPVNIGDLTNPDAQGIGNWGSAQILTGNFTGTGVQDVMAYYPAAGAAVIVPGSGAAAPLQPSSLLDVPPGAFTDCNPKLNLSTTSDTPKTLVDAGNASELGAPYDDLIGIIGDPANGYALDLYSTANNTYNSSNLCATGGITEGMYAWDATLSSPGQAPDPANTNWADYSLATAELGGSPSDIALLALSTTDGSLWESVSPGCQADTCSAGTWTRLTVPWTAASVPASLVSADINSNGTELWATNGTTLTPYTVGSTAVTAENSGTAISYAAPAHQWPLDDGTGQNPQPDTATDITGGQTATFATGPAWGTDDFFDGDADLNPGGGSNGLATGSPAVDTAGSYTVSAWVKINTPADYNQAVLAQDGNVNSGFYLGVNSYCGDCWDFYFAGSDTTNPAFGTPAEGPAAQPGIWTDLAAVYDAGTQTAQLYVNGILTGTTTVTTWPATGSFTIGQDLYNGAASDFIDGSIADVQTWNTALTPAQISAMYY